MDTDDISSPNRLRKQLNFLLNTPVLSRLAHNARLLNDRGKKIGRSDFPTEHSLIYENPLHGISMQFETVLINKTLLPKDILRFHTGSNPFIIATCYETYDLRRTY